MTWSCTSCTFDNAPRSQVCEMCRTAKPSAPGSAHQASASASAPAAAPAAAAAARPSAPRSAPGSARPRFLGTDSTFFWGELPRHFEQFKKRAVFRRLHEHDGAYRRVLDASVQCMDANLARCHPWACEAPFVHPCRARGGDPAPCDNFVYTDRHVKKCVDCGGLTRDSHGNPGRIDAEKAIAQRIRDEDARLGDEGHIVELHACGVTVDFLLEFTFAHDCWDKPTWWVNRHIIKPATQQTRCRYAHLPGMERHRGPAHMFVSHCWGSKWGDMVVAACEGARYDRIVWVDLFAVRQWPGRDKDLNFRKTIDRCSALTVCTSEMEKLMQPGDVEDPALFRREFHDEYKSTCPFLRLWCLVEISHAVLKNKNIFVQVGRAEPVPQRSQKVYQNLRRPPAADGKTLCPASQMLYRLTDSRLNLIDLEHAAYEDQDDFDREYMLIETSSETDFGPDVVNRRVVGALRGAVFQQLFKTSSSLPCFEVDAAACGEPEALRHVMEKTQSTVILLERAQSMYAARGIRLGPKIPMSYLHVWFILAVLGGRAQVVEDFLRLWGIRRTYDDEDNPFGFEAPLTWNMGSFQLGMAKVLEAEARAEARREAATLAHFLAGEVKETMKNDLITVTLEHHDSPEVREVVASYRHTDGAGGGAQRDGGGESKHETNSAATLWMRTVILQHHLVVRALEGSHFDTAALLLDIDGVDVQGFDNVFADTPERRERIKQASLKFLEAISGPGYDPSTATLPETPKTTLLWDACHQGQLAIVNFLLQRPEIDVNLGSMHALPATNYEVHCNLIIEGLDDLQYSPLHAACQKDHGKIVQRLLEHKDVVVHPTAVFVAVYEQNTEALKALLQWANENHPDGHMFILKILDEFFESMPDYDAMIRSGLDTRSANTLEYAGKDIHAKRLSWCIDNIDLVLGPLKEKRWANSQTGKHTRKKCAKGHGLVIYPLLDNPLLDFRNDFRCGVCGECVAWTRGNGATLLESSNFTNGGWAFACEQCGFDVCSACEAKDGPDILLKNVGGSSRKVWRGRQNQIGMHTKARCVKNHGLARFKTQHKKFARLTCDVCNEKLSDNGAVGFGCTTCGYDVCATCESILDRSVNEEGTAGVGGASKKRHKAER